MSRHHFFLFFFVFLGGMVWIYAMCDVCDVFDLKNIIKEPTCFKADIPTLVDVFLTNKPRSFSGVINTDIGSSDFHNFIGVAVIRKLRGTIANMIVPPRVSFYCREFYLTAASFILLPRVLF